MGGGIHGGFGKKRNTDFYVGGNGQAHEYYNTAIKLEVREA